MAIVIVEIKARCENPDRVRDFLHSAGGRFVGTDHQTDTYFRVPKGRLKLREGTIENALIHYDRPNEAGPKRSDVRLFKMAPESPLKNLLLQALEVHSIVEKQRDIWFIQNVKFHIDQVEGLGSFVEIEAISEDGSASEVDLRRQCDTYLEALGIQSSDLLSSSYSDMVAFEPH